MEQPPSVPIPTEVFHPPSIKTLYRTGPPAEATLEREGWVTLSFMVDTTGRPYEVAVTDSTGSTAFEKLAVNAIERSTFKPATLNGNPIDAVSDLTYTFTSSRQPGAGAGFIKTYKRLQELIKAGDRAAADDAIRDLKITNLYEDAYWSFGQYLYATRWGNEAEQLHYLIRALGPHTEPDYLPLTAWRAALLECLGLQVKLRQYAEAIQTWSILKKHRADAETMARTEQLMAQLEKVRASDDAYDVSGVLSELGWSLHLFKPRFHIAADGSIADVKLRCDKGYLTFAFDPNIDYRVQGNYGSCTIQLEGIPGTRLTLTQH
jgi:TonB family protein